MLVNPITRGTWKQLYPGRCVRLPHLLVPGVGSPVLCGMSCCDLIRMHCRRILLDIGTGQYKSGSLPWFTEVYRQKGVEFNEIFGTE